VLADGFFEWQWLDDKGKQKKKFLLTLPNEEAFAFAGLWSEWVDTSTGEIIPTFTILTTAANPLMAHIHNTKQRMPVILAPENEQSWLNGQPFQLQNDRLQAIEL
jgi:putative SOS response-associated peptidase YedK